MTEPVKIGNATLYLGDCLEILRTLPDSSVDSVVTDPPYGLGKEPDALAMLADWLSTGHHDVKGSGFMGKAWDAFVPQPALWRECLRVLKPGGHLLAFAGTRTHDLMTLGLRIAGFEIRDTIMWVYGSGFPKSLDVSKAIDKQRTEDRAPVDAVRAWLNARRLEAGFSHDAVNKHFGHASNGGGSSSAWMTNPTSRALPTWEQWQSLKALFGFGDDMDAEVRRLNGRKGKPGDNFESREVLSEAVREVKGGSWADNAATGRYSLGEKVIQVTCPATDAARQWGGWGTALKPSLEPITVARKPLGGNTVAANVLAHGTGALNIDGCRVEHVTVDGGNLATNPHLRTHINGGNGGNIIAREDKRRVVKPNADGRWPANLIHDGSDEVLAGFPDSNGSAARFFYCAKASKADRGADNNHPTVKPTDLMRYLCRLVTPPGGTVLDPFTGSGSTGKAAMLEGFAFIGVELDPDYAEIACRRIEDAQRQGRRIACRRIDDAQRQQRMFA